MSEPIKRVYLNAESGLNASQRRFLTYANPSLVPCEMEQEKDSFTLMFDDTGLRSYNAVFSQPEAERYRALANIAELEELCFEYVFSLAPSNLLVDVNLLPKVLERNACNSVQEQEFFLKEFKALIGAVVQPQYSFEDYLCGGDDLYRKHKALERIVSLDTAQEIRDELLRLYTSVRIERAKNYTQIRRINARIYRILIPVLGVLTVFALAVAVYLYFFVVPHNDALIAGNNAYLQQDYIATQNALQDLSLNDLPYETKYMLARSYVMTEGLSAQQRSNVLEAITIQTDDRYFCYWITVGRLEFDEAIDYAKQLGDDELELYAWASKRIFLMNNTTLSGADKEAQINQADSEIERIQKKIDENNAALVDEDEEGLDAEGGTGQDTKGKTDKADSDAQDATGKAAEGKSTAPEGKQDTSSSKKLATPESDTGGLGNPDAKVKE